MKPRRPAPPPRLAALAPALLSLAAACSVGCTGGAATRTDRGCAEPSCLEEPGSVEQRVVPDGGEAPDAPASRPEGPSAEGVVEDAGAGTGESAAGGCDDCRRCGPSGDALCVFPGAVGFGADTAAGRGGAVHRVTTLAASGPGSLEDCVQRTGPRVCVFEVSGTIARTRDLLVDEPYLTIAGQTAPDPGVTLAGAGLFVRTHDVLVQHLRVRVGDGPDGPSPGSRDGVRITGTRDDVHHVVLDHLSVSWAIDEVLSTVYDVHDVTVSHSIISEGLDDSLHPKGPHSKAILVRENTRNLALVGNLIAHNADRNPRIVAGSWVVAVNNVIYDPGRNRFFDVDLGSHGGDTPHRLSIVGNVFVPGADTPEGARPVLVDPTVVRGTEIFVDDNVATGAVLVNRADFEVEVPSPPVWSPSIRPLPAAEAEAWVAAHVGARPAARDAVDARVVAQMRGRTGRIVDSVAEAGGFPELARNRRPFVEPADPHGDDDGDGYTNLEEVLHGMARAVTE